MPDNNNKSDKKKPYPMQVYLPIKTREAFDRKLLEEFEYAPSRSKMIRTWIEAVSYTHLTLPTTPYV